MVEMNELLDCGAVSHRHSAVYCNSRWLLPGLPPYQDPSWTALRLGEWNTIFECGGPGLITHLWFAFPPEDRTLGRRTLVRMFWDGEAEPSVEAPLTDFFGVPFAYTGADAQFVSRYLVIAPTNGLNCYFPMPFAESARIEMLPEQIESGGGLYFQADYYRFRRELPTCYRDLRFHAQFRLENPCEEYGRNYLFLDAMGKGVLVGATFGIEMQPSPADAWFHGGGDSLFIDGEGEPTAIHGIGGEDFLGMAWGAEPSQSPATGVQLAETGEQEQLTRIALYRFYVDDPVPFAHSLRGVLGALGNAYSSVAYWYQSEPHRPFFRVPGADERMPGAALPYGTCDLEPANATDWQILAPFPLDETHPFEEVRLFERRETGDERFIYRIESLPSQRSGNTMAVHWKTQRAYHNFVDFNAAARPAVQTIRLEASVVGYALRYVECPEAQLATVHVGFDDDMLVRINDKVVYQASHPRGFQYDSFQTCLQSGHNRILVKLTNYDNTTWRLWAFMFRVEGREGGAL